jgi:hypothetical protein
MTPKARTAGLVVVAVGVASEPAPADGEAVIVIPRHAAQGLHGVGGEGIDAAAKNKTGSGSLLCRLFPAVAET